MSQQSWYVYVLSSVFSILVTLSLPVYHNAHVNSICKKLYSFRCLFYFPCSTGNTNKYKGKYLIRRIPHTSDGSKLQSFAILNKHTHIINGNIPVALQCVRFFSQSEPLRTINPFLMF